jgi:hypothetical protein
MVRRLSIRFLGIAFLAAASVRGQVAADGIVGRWRSLETSKGGIGAMYEFRADGAVGFSPGAVVEMPYRLEGDQLILPPATTAGPEQRSTIVFQGDAQLRMVTGGAAEDFRRQGTPPDPQNQLLGEWLGSRDLGGQRVAVHMFFYPAGRLLLLIPFETQWGGFTVTGGRLVATFGGKVGLDGPLDLAGGVLSINRGGGRTTKLVRY